MPMSHTVEVSGLMLTMSCLPAYSHPPHCPVMSRRALTLPPTSTGCTAGQQAATWPRATTTGSRRARPCPTQAAGWACMQGRSTRPWPSSIRPEKVQSLEIKGGPVGHVKSGDRCVESSFLLLVALGWTCFILEYFFLHFSFLHFHSIFS